MITARRLAGYYKVVMIILQTAWSWAVSYQRLQFELYSVGLRNRVWACFKLILSEQQTYLKRIVQFGDG